ncbi:sugar-binding protein [Methylosinus trichosporium OB3b]|uniref:Sugar-binding protein n=1 Tax=Methylosinus trichosporium (strain ATCC 35070 / NCIMB 11131 / UNIQEM 75 / OB3b) TaxID=595536 RepID=A0A2D2CVQ8_METT3|nr:sugar-binding protein [Methylosinus trichosporium OB3b]
MCSLGGGGGFGNGIGGGGFGATGGDVAGAGSRNNFDRSQNQGDRADICVGDPINFATGSQFEKETDYSAAGRLPLTLIRYYNSMDPSGLHELGRNWHLSYSRSIAVNGATAAITRDDGRVLTFTSSNGTWTPPLYASYSLSSTSSGYTLITDLDETETYNSAGKLLSYSDRGGLKITLVYDGQGRVSTIKDLFGRTMTFSYNSGSLISRVQTPDGNRYDYGYNADQRLTSVTFPDGSVRRYLYERSGQPNSLTGVVDENNIRYTTTEYDDSGRAVSSQHAGGADRYSVSYDNLSSTGVVDVKMPLGGSQKYTLKSVNGLAKQIEQWRGCAECSPNGSSGQSNANVYDSNGNVKSYTDFNGNKTTAIYDQSRNLPTSETLAAGTPVARSITTTWHSKFRLPTKIVDGARTFTYSYDAAKGVLLTAAVATSTSSSTRTYAYNNVGQVTSATDPRGRVTGYAYDAMGNLSSVTNARGHTTAFTSYDANGRPLTIQDPNGVVTTLTYNFRGQITSSIKLGQSTTYTYDATGQLTKRREPTGATLYFGYDAAHRLTSVRDGAGNKIVYTLDAAGNRIGEEAFDPSGVRVRKHNRGYDGLERLSQDVGAYEQTSMYDYDSNDNTVGIQNPNGNVTAFTYDALDRLSKKTYPLNDVFSGGAGTIVFADILYAYDANGRLASVTDPRGLTTRYTNNLLDLPDAIASPDTRLTSKTYDAAGNVLTSTDALSQTTTYLYDQLSRLVKTTYADGSIATYVYDQGDYGIGRLTSVTDSTGTTSFAYDAFGHVVQKTQTIGAVTLTSKWFYHATNGRLIGHTYPSGFKLLYSYDSAGRVSAITLQRPDGTQSTLIGAISYGPFETITSWNPNVSGGGSYIRSFNADGRITNITSSTGNKLTYTYDAGGRIKSISESNLAVKSFYYDRNDRLIRYARASNSILYDYDNADNRTSAGGSVYTISTTGNRIASIVAAGSSTIQSFSWDAAGGLRTHASDFTLGYDKRNRLVQAKVGALTTKYGVNDLGQRVTKSGASGQVEYFYDLSSHVIGTYDQSGAAKEEIVWLGDLPVATLQSGAAYFIMPDQLGAPHEIVNAANARVWFWDHDPFGNGAPTATAGFSHDLRFPGQIYDAETRLHYNGFRDYSPTLGRYVQSDPIGLAGGINTYNYVNSNPLSNIDSSGLETLVITSGGISSNPFGHSALAFTGQGVYSYGTADLYGSSTTAYIQGQLVSRSVTITTLKTTSEQEESMANYYKQNYGRGTKYSVISNNCANAAAGALSGAGVIGPLFSTALMLPYDPQHWASQQLGSVTQTLAQGSALPSGFDAFNPR